MRKIEFRGKRKDNGEWVYGDYFTVGISDSPDRHYISVKKVEDSKSIVVGVGMLGTLCCYEVIPETVGQFTGLLDEKTKRELYDGDICRTPSGRLIKLVWDDEILSVCMQNIGKDTAAALEMVAYVTLEYVGNIHENPELLENL